ncbi:InlB B-repeat-containing protein, partial [Aquiluna sp.]|nr:InlB B-repeat-containing protein [Aquiluna sp.]
YAITYSSGANGSGADQTQTKIEDKAETLASEANADSWFTRAGFEITGWSTTDGGAKTNDFAVSYTDNSNLTLYPVWTASTVTVTFKSNYVGGAGDSTQTISNGIATNLTANAFTRTGYTFAGWDLAADGSGTDYTDEQSVTITTGLTLFAKWTADSHTVTWNSNGGSSVTSSAVNTDANLTSPTAPTRSGFNFAGWSATDGGAVVSFPFTHGKTADFTMYAVWERATYTVTFDYNYVGVADGTLTHNSGGTVTLPTPSSRSGYEFKGWYTAASGGTKVGDAGATASTLSGTDLILRYELDDPNSYAGTGTTVTDISSAISNVSGAVNATSNGSQTFSTKEGMYFDFDGVDDHILTGDLETKVGTNNLAVSIFAWVYPTGNGVIVSELGVGSTSSGWHDSQIEVVASGANSVFKFRTWGGTYSGANAVTSDPITLNQWYYVGLTYDDDGQLLTGYVNGSAVGTQSYLRNAPMDDAGNGLYYGIGLQDITNLGDGTYGNFRLGSFHVYKSGISADTVLDNYQATCIRFDSGCTQQTLYAQWDVSEYVVTYAAGDNGTGASQTATKSDGVSLTLPDSATANGYFTRTGYTVTSWSTNSDGSTSDYTLGGSYTTDEIETLYPVWTPNTYTITFNKGASGTGSDVTATKTHDVDFTIPNSATSNGYFTRTGYTVSSWSTSADGSTSDFAFGASYSTEAAETLYPVWTPNTYTVTYNYNGATGGNGAATSSFTVDGIVVSLPTPTKPGYTFAGWYSDSGLTASIGAAGASYSPTADVTAYAKWTAATFTVIYDYNDADGGNSTASNTFTTGGTVITLPTPTRTGYTFAGWYSNSNLTDLSVVGAAGASYSPTTNLTVYAKWTAITRSVTYNTTSADSGTAPTDATDYTIGQSVVIKANTGNLVRTGYTFAGWVTNSDGSGTAKNAGETLSVATADIALYPQWSANTYTVTYNRNGATGGSLAKATDSYTTGQSPGLTLAGGGTMTKTGYSFAGWSASTSGTIPLGTYTTTTNVTLYAIWSPVDYTFSYDLNTGSGSAPSDQAANVEETVTVSGIGSATKAGHWFAGWNSATDGTGTSYAVGSSTAIPVGGQTVYAIWVPDAYKISYNANGGTGGPDLSATGGFDTATFGQSYSIRPKNNIARTGYTFSHWTTSAADAGSKYDAAQNSVGEQATYTPTANTVFYAQWTAVSYSLTFETNGGSAAIGTQTRTIGQTLSMPSAGTKTGYTFDSWSDGVNSYPVGSTYTVAAANAAFTAQWIPNVYTVTYDWQGGIAAGAVKISDSFTVGTGAMTLPTGVGSSYTRDGYDFAGWSTSAGGSAVSSFEPTADDVLYALWDDGNYTLSYDAKGGTGSGAGSVARTGSITLPTPVRSNFTFVGWYDQATGGSKLGDGGASYTPVASTSFYARWVQNSLYGVDEATLETAATLTVGGDQSGGSLTRNHSASGTAASVVVPNGALPANTVVTARYFKDTERQSGLIPGDNNYIFSLLVSWLTGSGDSATVPNTAAGKPISVTLTSSAIKTGQMIYQVVGTTVTELGRATSDGSITVELTEDPEIVIAATKPSAPTSVSAVAGDTQATVSWTAPESGGSAITGYTVTSNPGSFTCTTATTSCVVTGLTNGTSYTFTVTATNSVGTSTASGSSSSIAVAATTYNASFNANGGSSVSTATFIAGGSISEPTAPTKSGYTFNGWSTTLDDAATKVTFPYSPGVTTNITLYALWTADPVPVSEDSGNSGNGSGSTPSLKPIPPATPVTKPVGSVAGSTEQIKIVADAPKEKLVATGLGWELQVAAKAATGEAAPVKENLNLEFQLGSRAQVSGSGLRPKTTVSVWV